MLLRLLCSAADPITAWYLRFRLSEQMMSYLRDIENGRYLPHQRFIMAEDRVHDAAIHDRQYRQRSSSQRA